MLMCEDCGWIGCETELVCAPEDVDVFDRKIKFDRCPDCGGTDFEEEEDEEGAEE